MQHFYSHGKLLLTAEYVVLDGAKALALPTKFGQKLTVETTNKQKLVWQSIDYKGNIWFEDELNINTNKISHFSQNNNPISKRLLDILNVAKTLNPEFLKNETGYKVVSKLEFPNNWGLGSSSTLLNNIAQWANVDTFALSNATFGGSGYDIACAKNTSAIIYTLENHKPSIFKTSFKKPFQDHLFFIHLNRKQDSRESIKTYKNNKENSNTSINKINKITSQIISTNSLSVFQNLIEEHEYLIGRVTNQTPIKKRLFSDYKNQIKSLGGWNGDFILATGEKEYVEFYFKNKGYNTIVNFNDMIL